MRHAFVKKPCLFDGRRGGIEFFVRGAVAVDNAIKVFIVGFIGMFAPGAMAAFAADVEQLQIVFFHVLAGRGIVIAGAIFEADRVASDAFAVELPQVGVFGVDQRLKGMRVPGFGLLPDFIRVIVAIAAAFG